MPTTAQRIAKNFAALAVAEVGAKLLAFVAIVYLARTLAVGDFGVINFALAILTYFMLIPNAGLPLFGTREIAKDEARVKDYANNILTLRLIFAAIGFCLLTLLAIFLPQPQETKYLLILYGLSLFPAALFFDWVFQGIQRMEFIGVARVLQQALYIGLVFALVKSSEQLLAVPLIYLAAICLASLFLFLFFIRRFGMPSLKINLSLWKSFLSQALPMGFSFIMIMLYINFDTIMLQFMRGEQEVGYYNAAYKIILFITGLGGMYYTAIFPVISHLYHTSLETLHRLLSATNKLVVTIALPLAVGGTLLARPIMNLLYGSRYDAGIIGFQILIWAAAVILVSSPYSNSLLASGRQNRFAIGVAVGAAVNLVLNFILIPLYGLTGAAIATLVTEVVVSSLMYSWWQKIMSVPLHIYLTKPAISCTVMGAFLYFCPDWNLILVIVSGAIIYFVVLLLSGGVKKAEIGLIWKQVIPGGK
jgi:O-antigen/teichoic acid export membrane protein